MPSIATQTCSTQPPEVKAANGLRTPPDSIRSGSSRFTSPSSSTDALHGQATPYDHLADAFENVPEPRKPRVRVQVQGQSRRGRPSVHIHIDNVHVTPVPSPIASRPRMVDTGVQAGESCLRAEKGWFVRLKKALAPAKPYWDVVWTVALFFLDRVGFGVRLN